MFWISSPNEWLTRSLYALRLEEASSTSKPNHASEIHYLYCTVRKSTKLLFKWRSLGRLETSSRRRHVALTCTKSCHRTLGTMSVSGILLSLPIHAIREESRGCDDSIHKIRGWSRWSCQQVSKSVCVVYRTRQKSAVIRSGWQSIVPAGKSENVEKRVHESLHIWEDSVTRLDLAESILFPCLLGVFQILERLRSFSPPRIEWIIISKTWWSPTALALSWWQPPPPLFHLRLISVTAILSLFDPLPMF
jgi:hypothetical protein